MIEIDEEKCNGCGECTHICAEAALQIVNGKAKVITKNMLPKLDAFFAAFKERDISNYAELQNMVEAGKKAIEHPSAPGRRQG